LPLGDSVLPTAVVALGSAFLLFKTFVYWRMQFVSASMVSGIPKGSSVVEIDAKDGKNVFYLPSKVDYTAVMSSSSGAGGDPKKEKEKVAINNQLILESIGKANRGGLGLTGKVRSRTQDIPSKSADCVLSVGAIRRADSGSVIGVSSSTELVNEAFRILRPGGLFVFVEPDGGGKALDAIQNVSY
jgi:SAM-dependent methyltransferase